VTTPIRTGVKPSTTLMLKMRSAPMTMEERRTRAYLALIMARYDTDYIPTGVWGVVKKMHAEIAQFEMARA